jgi:LCP family protein required for cell wall assembly
MHIRKSTNKKLLLVRWIVVGMILGIGGYALFSLLTSGLIPVKYGTIAAVLYVTIGLLALLLTFRRFHTKRRRIIARIVATGILLLILVGSVAGLYALNRSLSMLDKVSSSKNAVDVEVSEAFNIFISGIDTYGDISARSRSDVNIVATVNPKTHKVLLTTIPRDSYVSIALGGNDGMDKITHAGNYGVESSTKTAARLLDTTIDAYVRINFTSFIQSIDTLGGITINNPSSFSMDGQHFPAGMLQLDGKKALQYSRERKSLRGGDVDRGKNQQRVIQGIIDKMTQVRSISGFEALLSMIGSSVETNLSTNTIKRLINNQVADSSSWETSSYTLAGKGQTGGLPSYAMPSSQLYMYVLDPASVAEASSKIDQMMK